MENRGRVNLKEPVRICMTENLRKFNNGVEKLMEDMALTKVTDEPDCKKDPSMMELRNMIESLNRDMTDMKEGLRKVTVTLQKLHEFDNIVVSESKQAKKELMDRLELLDSRVEALEVFAGLTNKRMQAEHESLVKSFEVVGNTFMKIHEDMMHLSSVLNGVVMTLSNGTGGFSTANDYQEEAKKVSSVYKSFKFNKQ